MCVYASQQLYLDLLHSEDRSVVFTNAEGTFLENEDILTRPPASKGCSKVQIWF